MKRLLPVLVTVFVAATITSCGGGQQNTLAGRSPSQVIDAALSASRQYGGVHYNVQSTGSSSGTNGEGDAGLTSGDEILTSNSDKVALLYVKPDVFIRGNAGGLHDILALNATFAQRAADKWMSIPKNNPLWSQVASVTTIAGLLHELEPTGTLEQSTPGKLGSYQVVGVRGKPLGQAGTATFWVSTVPPNALVSAESDSPASSGSSGTSNNVVVFSKWGEKLKLTAPSPVVAYSSIAG